MNKWKESTKEYAIYCREDRKTSWINDITALDRAKFSDLPTAYEDQKKSFIKTAEIMKALDEGESWEQIASRLMEGHGYCQYPIGVIGHMLLTYSKHGIEFIENIIGNGIELMDALREEFHKELEEENKKKIKRH